MARTEGTRQEPRKRPSAKPAPKRPNLPTVEDQKPESSGLGKKLIIGVGAVVVLVGLTVLSFGLANETDPADTLPDVDVEIVGGETLAPFSDPANDPAIGQPAPEVTSVDFDGQPASILNDGTPKMILFLAHWCPHCQREVPALQAWVEANGLPDGVDFVSVATSISEARPNFPPNAWLEREGWTQRIVMDDRANTIGTAFGLSAFPYYVLVDANGNVVQRITGEQDPANVGLLLQALAELPAPSDG